jgi:tetratricopeptide (TPR) repeat protein
MNVVPRQFLPHGFLAVSVVMLVTVLSTTALAQSEREPAEITDRQIELNEEGVRAIISGDQEKAVAVLSESLAYGEANATYLNLGRAYQKLGNCKEAREALEKALTAPVVDDPPPRVIDKKANEYLGELDETCPEEEPANDEKDQKAAKEDSSAEEKAEKKARETEDEAEKTARKADDDQADQSIEDPGEPPTTRGGGNGLAFATIGVGAAAVGTGIFFHLQATAERNQFWDATEGENGPVIAFNDRTAAEIEQRANTYDTVGLSADIVGGALIGVGVVMLLTNDNSSESASFNIVPTRGGAAASYRVTF